VLLNGHAIPSCAMPISAVKDQPVVTLEGLAKDDDTLHPVQQAFIEEQSAQCGYCLNGMVITAVALLNENPRPDEAAIRAGLERCLCRCGSQSRIIRAVKRAAEKI